MKITSHGLAQRLLPKYYDQNTIWFKFCICVSEHEREKRRIKEIKMDNFKSPNLNGKKVLSITFPGIEGCCPPTSIIVGELFDKMIYYCEYLGEYGIDWVLCYKNEQLVAQHNVKFIQSVEFETE